MAFLRSETIDTIIFSSAVNFAAAGVSAAVHSPFSFAIPNEELNVQDWIKKIEFRKDFFINNQIGNPSGASPSLFFAPSNMYFSALTKTIVNINSYGNLIIDVNLYTRPLKIKLNHQQPINYMNIVSDTEDFLQPSVLSVFGVVGDTDYTYDITAVFSIICTKSDKKYNPRVVRKEKKTYLDP